MQRAFIKSIPLRLALAALVLGGATQVAAKPLVVCTEASPEGFDVVQYTTGVTFDASSETLFNRLVDFKPALPISSRPWPSVGRFQPTA